jgi:putative flippase GtrA
MPVRFLKFFLSRLLGTLVDTLILWILTRLVFFSYVGQYIIAPGISFEITMLHNYALSYFFIWNKSIPVPGARDFFIRLISYNISVIFGFLIKLFFLLLFERIFGWDVIYCNLAALFFSGFVNFFLSEKLVFRKSPFFFRTNGYFLKQNPEEADHSVKM